MLSQVQMKTERPEDRLHNFLIIVMIMMMIRRRRTAMMTLMTMRRRTILLDRNNNDGDNDCRHFEIRLSLVWSFG